MNKPLARDAAHTRFAFFHFVDTIERPIYDQVTSIISMNQVLEDALREYNETNATMDTVLFEDAMKKP